jgi:hypothetical protein
MVRSIETAWPDLGCGGGRAVAHAKRRSPRQRPLGLGPTFVVLRLDPKSPWVYGVLVNNIWSVDGGGSPYNNLFVQPFLNYNLPGGTYLTTSPVITAN